MHSERVRTRRGQRIETQNQLGAVQQGGGTVGCTGGLLRVLEPPFRALVVELTGGGEQEEDVVPERRKSVDFVLRHDSGVHQCCFEYKRHTYQLLLSQMKG